MSDKLYGPNGAPMAEGTGVELPAEYNVMVNVNDNPTPVPIAKLIVMNEVATNLERIAKALERAYPLSASDAALAAAASLPARPETTETE